jgi:hypothetical protein
MQATHPTRSEQIKRGIRRARLAGKEIGANGRRLAAENHAEAIARAAELFPLVVEFRGSGLSYRQMVVRLNARNAPTPGRTGRWHVRTLQRLVARAGEVEVHLAHAIIARSDAAARRAAARATADRVEAALATAQELRAAQHALKQRALDLTQSNRALCAHLGALRLTATVAAARLAAATQERASARRR